MFPASCMACCAEAEVGDDAWCNYQTLEAKGSMQYISLREAVPNVLYTTIHLVVMLLVVLGKGEDPRGPFWVLPGHKPTLLASTGPRMARRSVQKWFLVFRGKQEVDFQKWKLLLDTSGGPFWGLWRPSSDQVAPFYFWSYTDDSSHWSFPLSQYLTLQSMITEHDETCKWVQGLWLWSLCVQQKAL